jgi:hypothetical protein
MPDDHGTVGVPHSNTEGQHMTQVQASEYMTPEQRAMAEWNNATANAFEVEGYQLIGGKIDGEENPNKMEMLAGVPFNIQGITFRRGDRKDSETKEYYDYVSLECLIHPAFQSKFKRPRVVFNDGGTGIYRQIVSFLASQGKVTVDENLPEEGPRHATRYDVSYTRLVTSDDGKSTEYNTVEFDTSLTCPEGLRRSQYTNDYGDAETWYLA